MNKVLPININAPIQTECWSFYRTAIISAYEELKPWFFQNYNNLFSDVSLNLYYGENGQKYDQYKSYEKVLNTYCYSHKSIESDNLIAFIISNINDNKYILLDCDYNLLLKKEQHYTHEVLIYGYDDIKKIFFIPILTNAGVWEIKEILFEDLILAYKAHKCLDSSCKCAELYRRSYLSSINIFEINKTDINICLELFYKQIKSIKENVYRAYSTFVDGHLVGTWRDGYWACYNVLLEAASKAIYKDESFINIYNYCLNIKKMHEYKLRINQDWLLLISYFKLDVDDVVISYSNEIIQLLENNVNISLKYKFINDAKYMWDITNNLVEIFNKERVIIDSIYECLRKKLLDQY